MFASTKGCLMVGVKMFGLGLIFALSAVYMDGCRTACGDPSWLLRAVSESIGNYGTGPDFSALGQVCISRSLGD
ncbi:hypothetical protein MUNTM_18630 [Mycobacterium sp. MUNTM1]